MQKFLLKFEERGFCAYGEELPIEVRSLSFIGLLVNLQEALKEHFKSEDNIPFNLRMRGRDEQQKENMHRSGG